MLNLKTLLLGRWQDRLSTTIRLRILIGFGIAAWHIGFFNLTYFLVQNDHSANFITVLVVALLNGIIFTALGTWCLSQKSPIDHHLPTKLLDGIFWVLFTLGISTVYALQRLVNEASEIDPLLGAFLLIYTVPLVRQPSGVAFSTILLSTGIYAWNSSSPAPEAYWFALCCFGVTCWGLVLSTNMELLSQRALRNSNDELKLAQNTIEHIATQNERLRIGRDLHDQMGHNLAALSLQLQISDKLASTTHSPALQEQIAKAQESTRDLFKALRQAVYKLRSEGEQELLTTLRQMTNGFSGLAIELNYCEDQEIPHLEQADELVHVIKECITNTIKHSDASKMVIDINVQNNQLLIKVQDNGNQKPKNETGFGLLGIAERVALLKGTVNTYFQTNEGYSVDISIPIEQL